MADVEYVVIGGSGLIGSAVCAHLRSEGLSVCAVRSQDYATCVGLRARVVVNCNGNTYRFRANDNPRWDFDASVLSVERSLFDVQADLYVYLSTVDVYDCRHDPRKNGEEVPLHPERLDAYGFHKWMAERLVERFAPRSVILRLGTAVGQGLKKGPVYDLLEGQLLHMSADSELTLIDTATIARAVTTVVAQRLQREIFNVTGTGSVRLRDAAARVGVPLRLAEEATEVVYRYDVANAKLARLMPLPTSQAVLDAYLDDHRAAVAGQGGD